MKGNPSPNRRFDFVDVIEFCCLIESTHSFCRHGRNTSAAALAKVTAIVWAAPQHHHQIARGRRSCAGVVDSAGNDYWSIERSAFAAQRSGGGHHFIVE